MSVGLTREEYDEEIADYEKRIDYLIHWIQEGCPFSEKQIREIMEKDLYGQ